MQLCWPFLLMCLMVDHTTLILCVPDTGVLYFPSQDPGLASARITQRIATSIQTHSLFKCSVTGCEVPLAS